MQDTTLFNTQVILDLLKLEQLDADRFRGMSHFMGSPNVFGGQVLGQSLYAASVTVPNRRPHSLHSLFILPGNYRLPIEFQVERVRDGGSFSTRRVVAIQEGRRIFVMSASFQDTEQGLNHQKAMPAAAAPDTLPSSLESWKRRLAEDGRIFQPMPVDIRAEHGQYPNASVTHEPHRQFWTRCPLALPDDPPVHETLFAYVSDYAMLGTSLQPHGVRMRDPRLQIASLDHSIWLHRPLRMDEWLLFSIESPNAGGGRSLNIGHVYTEAGVLVATVAQEGLIRLRKPKAQ